MSVTNLESLELLTPTRYATDGYPHDAWSRLRSEAPICRIDDGVFEPYWAITRHAHLLDISRRPEEFTNRPTINVKVLKHSRRRAEARTIVHMDPPEHRTYRALASRSFTPRAIAGMEQRIRELAVEILDEQLAVQGQTAVVDFVDTVAAWHPLRVIAELLGLPREDHQYVLDLTNKLLSGADPEYMDGADAVESGSIGTEKFLEYMAELARSRRAEPRNDLATTLAEARIDGELLPDFELLSYYIALATAGHDTTRNALSGGLAALMDHPDQMELLRNDRLLLPGAADEILRWSTPVIHFARTAAADVELEGQQIRAGDRLALFYPSANRDEEVFGDPFVFDIQRSPNPHLSFGFGEHYCIGQALARLELTVLFDVLLDKVAEVKPAGESEHLASNFVGGIKHLPVALRLDGRSALA
jgi:cytochrome P450